MSRLLGDLKVSEELVKTLDLTIDKLFDELLDQLLDKPTRRLVNKPTLEAIYEQIQESINSLLWNRSQELTEKRIAKLEKRPDSGGYSGNGSQGRGRKAKKKEAASL